MQATPHRISIRPVRTLLLLSLPINQKARQRARPARLPARDDETHRGSHAAFALALQWSEARMSLVTFAISWLALMAATLPCFLFLFGFCGRW